MTNSSTKTLLDKHLGPRQQVLILFYSPECYKSKQSLPVFEKIEKSNQDLKIKFLKINTKLKENQSLVKKFHIHYVPQIHYVVEDIHNKLQFLQGPDNEQALQEFVNHIKIKELANFDQQKLSTDDEYYIVFNGQHQSDFYKEMQLISTLIYDFPIYFNPTKGKENFKIFKNR